MRRAWISNGDKDSYVQQIISLRIHEKKHVATNSEFVKYKGGLDRRLPERERLNMTSWLHVRGQPQKLCFQVCFQRLNLNLNA